MENFVIDLNVIEGKWSLIDQIRFTPKELDDIIRAEVVEDELCLYCNLTLKSSDEVIRIPMSILSNAEAGDVLDPKKIYVVTLKNPGDPNIPLPYIMVIYYVKRP